MSYTLKYTGAEIDDILDRAVEGGTIDEDLALKAPLESPALTGTPTAPTPAESDNSTKVATTAYADRAAAGAAAAAYPVDTASGAIASFADGANAIPMKSFVCSIEPIQAGSGDPSPSNIRAISGHTGVNAVVAGINVWDEETELGYYSNTDGTPKATTGSLRSKAANPIRVDENTAYYFAFPSSTRLFAYFYDKYDNYLSYTRIDTASVYTTPSDCYYVRFGLEAGYGTTYSHDISVNYPSGDASYHAYSGQTYPVTFYDGDDPLEVYKGTIDLVSGALKVTHGYKSVDGTENITGPVSNTGDYQRYYFTSVFPNIVAGSSADFVKCSHLKSDGTAATNGGNIDSYGAWCTVFNGNVRVGVPFATKALFEQWLADMKTAGTPVQFVYKLATPLVYNLTPTEVLSLLGVNNCYNDCGDTAVEYRADIALYVQKYLGGNVSTLSMSAPTPSLSLGRTGVLLEPEELEPVITEDAEPDLAEEEPEAVEEAEE